MELIWPTRDVDRGDHCVSHCLTCIKRARAQWLGRKEVGLKGKLDEFPTGGGKVVTA